MIAHGHEHVLRPVSVTPIRSDGSSVIHSRCQAANAGTTGVCGMEEERVVDAEGRVQRIRIRFGGMWFDPLDLLRVMPDDLAECPDCHGVTPLVPCACGGTGIVDRDGQPLRAPDLRVNPS